MVMHLRYMRIIKTAAIGIAGFVLLSAVLPRDGPLSALDLFPVINEGREFKNPRFSQDGRWLAFDLCKARFLAERCQNTIYDLVGDRYFAFRDAEGETISDISFSADGTRAVFILGPDEGRIAIADLRNNRYHLIADDSGIKRHPEFWKDDSVVYVGTEPGDEGRRRSKYLWIIEPGKPSRKLIEVGFYAPSRPRPHWDGEQILMTEFRFSKASRDRPLRDSGDEVIAIKPADGSVSVIEIQPTSEYHLSFSRVAVARAAKKIYFNALLKKESNQPRSGYRYDIFVLEGQVAKRISWLSGYFYGMDVSEDGLRMAMISADIPKRSMRDTHLLLYDPQTRTQQELKPSNVQERIFHSRHE